MTKLMSVHRRPRAQLGQAAIEAMICLLALGVLWAGVAWLGRIQDLALHASHASRHAAFVAARQGQETPLETMNSGVFLGLENQWANRRGQALPHSVYQDIKVSLKRNNDLGSYAQIGESEQLTAQLREDWLNTDQRVLSAQVTLVPSNVFSEPAGGSLLKLHQFEAAYPVIRRQTSILTGAGHSSDDLAAAKRIENSALAWSDASNPSYQLGRRVASVASEVDAAWGRPQPVFDWLQPWAEYLPSQHLRPKR